MCHSINYNLTQISSLSPMIHKHISVSLERVKCIWKQIIRNMSDVFPTFLLPIKVNLPQTLILTLITGPCDQIPHHIEAGL